MINVRLVESLDECASLKPAFDRLLVESESPHPTLTFNWLYLWFKHFGAGHDLFLLVAEEGAAGAPEIVGIAPLMIYTERTLKGLVDYRTVRLIGHSFTDRNDFIVRASRREAVIDALADGLFERRDRWDRLVLRHINDASPTFEYLCRAFRREGCTTVVEQLVGCPYLPISGSFDDYFKSRGSKFNSEFRRHVRRMTEDGFDPQLQILDRMDAALLQEFRELDQRRFAATGRASLFVTADKQAFLADIIETLNGTGGWRVYVFREQGRLVSYGVCFLCERGVYGWLTSYELALERYALGKMLLKETVRDCFDQGFRCLDFMIGDEGYKGRWADVLTHNHVITVTPICLKNQAVEGFNRLVARVRKLKSAWRGD